MFRFLCVASLSVALAGCISVSSIREDLAQQYLNKDAEVAVKAFGIPDREIQAAGRRAYVWEIGQGDCTVRMEVKDDRIVDVRVSGYAESCYGYTKKPS